MDARQEWFRSRIDQVHQRLSAHDVLRMLGVPIRQSGSDNEEQIRCPFHGKDNSPSARVYPATGDKPSSVWCFVCNERWDVFALWKNLKGLDDCKFPQILKSIENYLGLQAPSAPEGGASLQLNLVDDSSVSLLDRVKKLWNVADSNLRELRDTVSMEPYLKVSMVLDRIRYDINHDRAKPEIFLAALQTILAKLREMSSNV